jgi:GR25 family glycosyltransferase involved in LPS biosynthesis
MPVFERKDFFLDALESAINQTVKCEILVIDNCSSHDFFEKICTEKGVSYIRNETNIGLFPNWNKCMATANTEYAMILQDDNILELDFVENFQKVLNQYPNIDLYYTDFYKMDLLTKQKSKHNHTYPFGYFENGMKVIEYAIEYDLGLLYSVIIRTKKFTEYYYDFHGSNDWLWIYSNIKNFAVYGNANKVINYGTHGLQDSSNTNTHVQCIVTLGHIYDEVLSKTEGLSKENIIKANNKAKSAMLYFFSIVSKEKLTNILSQPNVYNNYLPEFWATHNFYKMYMKVPLSIRTFTFKVLRKLNLIYKF